MKPSVLYIMILATCFFSLDLYPQSFGNSNHHNFADSSADSIITNLISEISPDSIEYYYVNYLIP